MSQSVSSQLVEQAKKSLHNGDESKLAEAIEGLVAAEPLRWRQLLHLDGLWPEPSPQKVDAKAGKLPQTLSCLMKAVEILLCREDIDHLETVQEMMLTLQAFVILQSYYGDIIGELNKLEFVKSPPEVQIHRLVAYVESQQRTIQRRVKKTYEAATFYDPMIGYVSDIGLKFDDSKYSSIEAFEMLCENTELCLRFILHKHTLPSQPTFQPTHGPFKDPDFAKLGVLAGIWRMVAGTWADMRFRDWQWIAIDGQRRACVPTDSDAFLREHAGGLRYQQFIQARVMQRLHEQLNRPDYFDHLRTTAASITVPEAGALWDGRIELESLKKLCSLCHLRVVVEEYVNHRHYQPLIDRVKIGSIGWHDWVSGKEVLYCLADAMGQAVTNQVPDDDQACMRQVVIMPEITLVGIVVAGTSLKEEQARDLLTALRFDPKRKSLEVWDQPLIPCGDGLVLFVPSLVSTGSPARALENFINEWGGVSFDARGTPFEEYLVREIHNRSTARAEGGVRIQRDGENDLEFDVIVWWEGYLLLLEAKCEKTVFSPADYHRAKRQIEKSIDQLVRRRHALHDVWPALREKCNSLALPETYIGDDHVLCVSITNIMDFTGHSRDGVVVTDDSCFFRFFDDRMIKKFVLGDSISEVEDVEAIRDSEVPHPAELMRYLLNPPQMRRLIEKMRLKYHLVPAITKRSPGFISVHIELDS